MTDEIKSRINWTPIIVTGAAGIGIYAILKLVMKGQAEDTELAKRIQEDWLREFEYLQYYTELIYAGGRIPTEQEAEIMSSLTEAMKWKEMSMYQYSIDIWTELGEMAKDIALAWGVVVGTTVAGYLAIKIIKAWTDKNRPTPPSWPCPACDFVGATKGALKHHIETGHSVNWEGVAQAQQTFNAYYTWGQNAVAVESGYYDNTFTWQWPSQQTWAIIGIAAAVAIIVVLALTPGAQVGLAPAAALMLA